MSIFTKVYPLEKFKTEMNSPVVIIYRLFSIPLVILFNLLKFHPNLTTLISFITLFVSGYFCIIGEFALGGIFILLTLVLDCVDGTLARLNNQESELGLKLESIHSDLTLIVFPSTLIVGLINDLSINIIFLFLLLISTSIYLKWRPVYSDSKIKDKAENLSFLMKIIYSQQKPNVVIRSSSVIGKLLFFLRYNTATQFGLMFALMIVFSFWEKELIIYPITVMIFSQIFFSLAVLIGSLVKKNLD
tara:strand:+ start:58 stop:795 length:738 start_codon:yes stop_codon:yes gene_type:complete